MTLPSTLIPPLLVLVFIGDSVICALAGVSVLTRQLTNMLGHFIFKVLKFPINLTILNILKDMPHFHITCSLP